MSTKGSRSQSRFSSRSTARIDKAGRLELRSAADSKSRIGSSWCSKLATGFLAAMMLAGSVGSASADTQLVTTNPGFEAGFPTPDWQVGSYTGGAYPGGNWNLAGGACAGVNYVFSTQSGPLSGSTLIRQITIPANASNVQASWLQRWNSGQPFTPNSSTFGFGSGHHDYSVQIWNTSDVFQQMLFTTQPSDPTNTMGPCVTKTADLSAYAGQTIKLVFAVENQGSFLNAFVDNLSVTYNSTPTATNDSFGVNEDSSGVFDVLANDSDFDGDAFTITNVTQPVEPGAGTVSINGSNQISYAPPANYNGTATFTYTAGDAFGDSTPR